MFMMVHMPHRFQSDPQLVGILASSLRIRLENWIDMAAETKNQYYSICKFKGPVFVYLLCNRWLLVSFSEHIRALLSGFFWTTLLFYTPKHI